MFGAIILAAALLLTPAQENLGKQYVVFFTTDAEGDLRPIGSGHVISAFDGNAYISFGVSNFASGYEFELPYGTYRFATAMGMADDNHLWDCQDTLVINQPQEEPVAIVCKEVVVNHHYYVPGVRSGTGGQ